MKVTLDSKWIISILITAIFGLIGVVYAQQVSTDESHDKEISDRIETHSVEQLMSMQMELMKQQNRMIEQNEVRIRELEKEHRTVSD